MDKIINRLTTNGCLYLNLAFKQHYILQVLTYQISQNNQLHLILYDGKAYIGAIYSLNQWHNLNKQSFLQQETDFVDGVTFERKNNLILNVYDIVKVYPELALQNQPIILRSLEVIQTQIDGPLGNQIVTLQQFMHKRSFHKPQKPIQVEFDQQTRKMVKINNQVLGFYQSQAKQIQIQNNLAEHINFNKQIHQKNNNIQGFQEFQINNQQYQTITNNIHQNRQTIENQIQQTNTNFLNKSISTNINYIQEEKHHPQNQQDLQEIETQKKGCDTNNFQEQDQNSKQTKRVSFLETKITNENIIQQGIQEIKEQNKNTKNIRNQASQIFQIEDDSDEVIIIDEAKSKDQDQMLSYTSNYIKTQSKNKNDEPTMFIKDLYQRMHRFQIQCRINFICKFVSQKGLPCTKLFLIDQKGDEIVCMVFDKATQRQFSSNLVKGKVYTFQNGQVTKQDNNLSICVPYSGITENRKFFQSFNPNKMLKVGQIYSNLVLLKEKSETLENSKYSKQISICGILIGFLEQPKLLKFQFKVIGILCDPQSQKSITFMIFVDQLSSFPQKGSVISLHNMKIFQDDHIIRLQPTRRSYVLNQKGNIHQYFAQMIKSSEKGKWKLVQYRNLSQIAFVSRNISQLKNILARILQHDFAYSEIDCSIVKITEKRIFNACIICKKETKPEPGLYTYCPNCKKINKYIKRAVFDLQVSDATGTIQLILCNANLQGFINMSLEQYLNHNNDDRECFLQLCTYQNIILKVKSQRIIGGSNHTAISAQKPSHKRIITQITSKILEEKTKYISCW